MAAPTGTGKTAAYGLPLLQRSLALLNRSNIEGLHAISDKRERDDTEYGEGMEPGNPVAAVLTPSRALAEQTHAALHAVMGAASAGPALQLTCVHGGLPVSAHDGLQAHVIIATVGRLLELAR